MALKLSPNAAKKPTATTEVVVSGPLVAKESKDKDKAKHVTGSLNEILASIRKGKGDKVVVQANKILPVERLPTGIFEFDFYTGGGFPFGRLSIVYGPESSNKTNLCLKAVASAQKLPEPCNRAIWVDVEQCFDPLWAEKMGVDTTKLLVVKPGYGEEAVDLIDALVRADDVAIVIVDSVAALIANKEIGQSVETYDIGTSALLIKRMVNKLMVAFGESQKINHFPCVILVNQRRFKVGFTMGDPEVMPGGEAQKFLASLRVRLSATNVIDKALNTVLFKDTKVTVKKAKVPVRAASFNFSLCVHNHDDLQIGETDSFNMVKSHLQALGLLVKTNKGYAISPGSPEFPKGIEFPTLTAIEDRYLKNQVFRMTLQALVIMSYKDKLMLVEEEEFSPKEVSPGTTVEITNG